MSAHCTEACRKPTYGIPEPAYAPCSCDPAGQCFSPNGWCIAGRWLRVSGFSASGTHSTVRRYAAAGRVKSPMILRCSLRSLQGSAAYMPARKTTAHYGALAERRELTWLGPIAGNTKALTGWRCCRGHEFLACYNNIDQRMRCKFCVREDLGQEQRHGPAEYHALAEKRGIFWLGPAVKSALAQTVWECPCEHRWSTRLNTIQQGRGCPRCGRERRVTRVEDSQQNITPSQLHGASSG